MITVLTAEDVRRQDEEAQSRGVTVEQLMENAGWAVARTAREMLGGTYGRRVVVVCGKGNNGGDGLVAARRLLEMGAHVTVVPVFPESSMNALATKNLERFVGMMRPLAELKAELARADLVIDAIFGVGLTRAPEGPAEEAIRLLAYAKQGAGGPIRASVLAVDLPSGMASDTGTLWGQDCEACVRADVTVSLGGYKPGLLFEPGRRLAGRIVIANVGASGWSQAEAWDAGSVRSWWRARSAHQHKRSSGVVLVVAGSVQMPGAAALTSAAAIHTGAGLTTLCAPEEVCAVALTRVPEMTTIPYRANEEGVLHQKVVDGLMERIGEFDSIAIGPGLTTHPATVQAVRSLVAATEKRMVLDADGINAFIGAKELLRERPENMTILTPHAGELSRLVDVAAKELDADRLGHARRIAEELGCVLVFKGPGTVTAAHVQRSPFEYTRSFVNPTGGAALAQGGTGDVLTGMVAATIAQQAHPIPSVPYPPDLNLFRAAMAVWLHGRAADRLAERLWPHPANASALIDEIGPTLHEMMSS